MLKRGASYEETFRQFRWQVPGSYNIGIDICDRHTMGAADGNRTALIEVEETGDSTRYSFLALKRLSNQLANALQAQGIGPGDRVAILLSQSVETAISHIAVYKLGAIAVPLFTLFGPEALEFRLSDSGAKALICDETGLAKVAPLRDRLPDLKTILAVRDSGADGPALPFWDTLERGSEEFKAAATWAEDPAIIIYTSGTTGNPKGALHAHRVLLGHLPGVEFPHEFFPQRGDLFWTPADWAWIGGLIDVLLPSLHHGVPVLAHRARKFDPEQAYGLMAKFGVRNVFMPPTALKLMRQAGTRDFKGHLRSIGSGGETLGGELLDWGRATFGLAINEFYGQTECNLVVGNCAGIMDIRQGSMGLAIPGHRVAIVDDEGRPLAPDREGHIAIQADDPVMFLGYWNNPKATEQKFAGDWLLTGDRGAMDPDGYFWFKGRADDVITSAGYRIGPGEIEDCLMKHPAVAMAAAIGAPDPLRTEIVKAFIVTKPEARPKDRAGEEELARAIQDFVKSRLAQHEYPRRIEFVEALPMTATGKIKRKDLKEMEIARQRERG